MFWEIFQKLCKENNTSPTEVMKKLKLSTSKITAWKSGAIPNGKILAAIADHFSVSVDYLLGRVKEIGKHSFTDDFSNVFDTENEKLRYISHLWETQNNVFAVNNLFLHVLNDSKSFPQSEICIVLKYLSIVMYEAMFILCIENLSFSDKKADKKKGRDR